MKTFGSLQIDEKKTGTLCRKHGIKLLVLHGSYAKGKTNKKSDIDIGILCNKKVDGDKHMDILGDFGGLFGDKFDPVFLNGVEPMISFHAATNGIPLYEAQKGNFAEFRIQAIGRYLDTKKFRELEKKYVKRAVR